MGLLKGIKHEKHQNVFAMALFLAPNLKSAHAAVDVVASLPELAAIAQRSRRQQSVG